MRTWSAAVAIGAVLVLGLANCALMEGHWKAHHGGDQSAFSHCLSRGAALKSGPARLLPPASSFHGLSAHLLLADAGAPVRPPARVFLLNRKEPGEGPPAPFPAPGPVRAPPAFLSV